MESKLISENYSIAEKRRMMPDSEPDSFSEAKDDLHTSLESISRYKYSYAEFLMTKILMLCGCCLKKRYFFKKYKKRQQRHSVALD